MAGRARVAKHAITFVTRESRQLYSSLLLLSCNSRLDGHQCCAIFDCLSDELLPNFPALLYVSPKGRKIWQERRRLSEIGVSSPPQILADELTLS